jgi:hypothetical protein
MSAVESGYDEPHNFKEAWNHEDQGAIQEEYRDMTVRDVWKYIKTSTVKYLLLILQITMHLSLMMLCFE